MAICKYLVEELGFDVNSDASDRGSGVTPLHFAVSHEQVTAVRYFLEKGADPNIKDSSNGTASLHEAAALGYDEITQLLLANGANVDEPSSQGTPLVAAAAHGKFSSMKILLEHHADPNKVSWEYGTPLTTTLYATPDRMDESTCLKCVKLLVEAGADVKCTNPETPLAIATTNGLTKCAEYLLKVATNANVPVKHDTDVKPSEDRRKARLKSNGPKAQLKSNGAKAVQENDYAAALKFYTEAIKLDPEDAVLYSNRSLCHLKCDEEYDALHDANACIRLKPDWNKGYYRKGAALMSLLEYKEASDAFLAGVKLKPENKEMEDAYWEAVEAMRKEQSEPSLYDLD
ncbi:poly [ADP-ribose] polymerase tankyrase-2-like [Lolium rigidum]|uniref:poly [ADP-ribose] polymerase tankyrase-2-like n=1 Tax=Lolium rigidum TaxID=89674 RepID=UPI001F5D53FA|nr:poly [ADP-ribose] polymerase tankyrase-2-like [Lolium rigidum]